MTIFFFSTLFAGSAEASSSAFICEVYFTGVGCPHCARTDPIVLEKMLREHPNLVIIEYEVYQRKENAPLIEKYNAHYESGLGIPLIIFNKDNFIAGNKPILDHIGKTVRERNNF